ncbi:hypothetical protein HCG49_00020 [Arenibacter sp. 6A1]|uniref:hypothetical protein n=1 Tax=Arenibacter sp. 6A1 TaxID=2720391 RepID=UPI001445516D|nr:hypothetical protein [Arenibacter sp. 6A1]NKI24940.1 hypothetical protein [Arenibacter sp. 6A1]
MKKLSLKNLNLGVDNLLQREQLKTVFGGYGGDGCPEGHARCSCTASDGGVIVGCDSSGNCDTFCD